MLDDLSICYRYSATACASVWDGSSLPVLLTEHRKLSHSSRPAVILFSGKVVVVVVVVKGITRDFWGFGDK